MNPSPLFKLVEYCEQQARSQCMPKGYDHPIYICNYISAFKGVTKKDIMKLFTEGVPPEKQFFKIYEQNDIFAGNYFPKRDYIYMMDSMDQFTREKCVLCERCFKAMLYLYYHDCDSCLVSFEDLSVLCSKIESRKIKITLIKKERTFDECLANIEFTS